MTNGSKHRETVKIDVSQRCTPAEKGCGRVLSNEEHRKKNVQSVSQSWPTLCEMVNSFI